MKITNKIVHFMSWKVDFYIFGYTLEFWWSCPDDSDDIKIIQNGNDTGEMWKVMGMTIICHKLWHSWRKMTSLVAKAVIDADFDTSNDDKTPDVYFDDISFHVIN